MRGTRRERATLPWLCSATDWKNLVSAALSLAVFFLYTRRSDRSLDGETKAMRSLDKRKIKRPTLRLLRVAYACIQEASICVVVHLFDAVRQQTRPLGGGVTSSFGVLWLHITERVEGKSLMKSSPGVESTFANILGPPTPPPGTLLTHLVREVKAIPFSGGNSARTVEALFQRASQLRPKGDFPRWSVPFARIF